MTHSGTIAPTLDLTALSLDAALQLDRLVNKKAADLDTIDRFGKQLRSTDSIPGTSKTFSFQENPVDIEILNTALYRSDGPRLVNVSDLEERLNALLGTISDIAVGKVRDTPSLSLAKKFCLSLHTALLEEVAPHSERDDWATSQQDLRFAGC